MIMRVPAIDSADVGEDKMRLFFYSSKSNTFVESKWIIVKCITGGIIIGAIIFFGFIKLNRSVGYVFGVPSKKSLITDNSFLQQQVNLITPRVNKLEKQAQQLNERANTFYILLHRRKIVVDTVSSFTDTTKGLNPRFLTLRR